MKSLEHKTKTISNTVTDNYGNLFFENENVNGQWKEYLEELYDREGIVDEWNCLELEKEVDLDCKWPSLTRSEFHFALNILTDKKVTGVDNIPAEILKNLYKSTKSLLFNIIGECNETGKMPDDFTKSKLVTIPKEGKPLIALFIKGNIEKQIGENQFWFMR